jgi:hypothetical protein
LRNAIGLGAVFSYQVRMFWPAEAFDEEYRESADEVRSRGLSPKKKKGIFAAFSMSSSVTYPANSWWVGRRGSCYIGVHCSTETKAETNSVKDAVYEVGKQQSFV